MTQAALKKKSRYSFSKIVSVTLLILVLIFISGFVGGWIGSEYRLSTNWTSPFASEDDSTVITTDEERISRVAKKVSPSVVSIVTQASGRYENTNLYLPTQSAGTGIILSKDGYIMTNHHVVDGAKDVMVILASGQEYSDVSVIGSDPLNDVAFLKVNNVNNLTPAQFGNSGDTRIGQQVVAIGNALGQFQTTVTSGIISAKGRPLVASSKDGTGEERLTDLLQTDAAINSGNSGGPLVDLSGRVIGMNTAIAADANGIGFAIPVNATRGMIEELLASGAVKRALLGVQYIDITPDVVTKYDLRVKKGALVNSGNSKNSATKDSSPAKKAGIKDGDIITKINTVEVGSNGSLSSIIGMYRPGDTVSVTIIRDGKSMTKRVMLGEY